MQTPKIVQLENKTLVGMCQKMSLSHQLTGELWRQFMPLRKEIENKVSDDFYSLQEYPADYFHQFDVHREFVKWALIEVNGTVNVPQNMEIYHLEGGEYAVFTYKGLSTDTSIFQYIYNKWIPNSEYELDDRPHFEVLGPKYKNNDEASEEEIWIPVKRKV